VPEILSYAVVPLDLAADAFAFHRKIATTNDHIWPRTEEDIRSLAESNQLLAAYYEPRDFVGLCYVKAEDDEWELGGLTVDPKVQAHGIGTTLARVAIAHTMAYNEPWKYGQEVIAYVHQANNDPRKLLEKLGFERRSSIEVPDDHAPASMKRNEQGKIVGDKFHFTREGLKRLSGWFDNESHIIFDKSAATINLGPATIDDLRVALSELATQYR
jgi:ribosomal protein S18 acetylase RimI-like enzyme